MKKLTSYFFYLVLCFAVSLRYRLRIWGLDKIKERKGILFLANHPAEIDPVILTKILWKKFRPRPVALDIHFQGGLRFFLEQVDALPIPGFDASSNSFKLKQIELTYEKILEALKRGDNILIYPAGGLKKSGLEVVGGASGVHRIIQAVPGATVVLVRSLGLWGSSFSKALTGKTPDVKKAFLHGAKIVLKNLIFFTPRRNVEITLSYPPEGFPLRGNRMEFNRALEKWYNAKGAEPLTLVSYAFWKSDLPQPQGVGQEERISLEKVSPELKAKVFDEISKLCKRPVSDLKVEENLAIDLGLDSLDTAQLVLFLKEDFGITGIHPGELKRVEDVVAYAAGLKKASVEEEEESEGVSGWGEEKERKAPLPPQGQTLIEAFLHTSKRMDSFHACADATSGKISYKRMRQGVILMAKALQKIPEERVGVMLPATVAVNVVILALHLAGKVPVMINWTLGERNLRAILESSKVGKTISSWRFLDRLENFDLDGFDENILLVDELRRTFTWKDKLWAAFLAQKSPQAIMRAFRLEKKTEVETAVILYTSGTESYPKGVPLSHKNILSNMRDAMDHVTFTANDVLLGVLPPFHSFGFSVTALFPLLAGLRVVFVPNPTDGRRMASAIEKWRVTLVCIAPTFLKNLLRVAINAQLKSLKMIVVGAEKLPSEIVQKVKELNGQTLVLEGYGITECAPILTINPPNQPTQGVGPPLKSVELLIVHPESHEVLKQGENGLILARGPNVFSGYLGDACHNPFMTLDGKQWYQTGDLGWIDERGYLTLSGRLKRFVKIGGEMVSLGAIEEILTETGKKLGWKIDPLLPSLAVISKEENGKKGEITLFTTFPLSLEEANSHLKKSGMSNLVRLSKVIELPLIPTLGTGKVDYRMLSNQGET